MTVKDREPVLKARKNRARRVSIAICAMTAVPVIIFCFATGTVVEYYPYTVEKNSTDVFYRKKEKLAFPGLFTAALGLLSIVLGTLVDRLSLIAEERHHLRERYGGSRVKMIKACFSGISWGPVISLISLTAVMVVLIIFLTGMPWFELRYLVYIFSGVGVGPLIMQLLNLNTQSEVHISQILEEKEMYVANGLAWSYYYTHLRQALQKFNKAVINHAKQYDMELSSNKLLLLMPLNCYMNDVDSLIALDERIEKLDNGTSPNHCRFPFPVYRFTVNKHEYKYFAIHCIKEPFLALREMCESKHVKSVTLETCEDEVKLLYRTLSQILEKPPLPDYESTKRGQLVPILVNNGEEESLRNGGLARCIMNEVEPSSAQTDGGQKPMPIGFYQRWKEKWKHCGKAAHKEQQSNETQVDPDTRNEQEGESNDKMEKKIGKTLQKKYKDEKSEETELRVMLPPEKKVEEDDPSDIELDKPKKAGHMVQEVGSTSSTSAASTSGRSSQMMHIADENGQSDEDEHSPTDLTGYEL